MRLATFGIFIAAFSLIITPATAGDRVALGYGRLLTNDWFGDNHDRWRTGSTVLSALRGPEGTQTRPASFGSLIEYRIGAAVIAPASLSVPAPGDRQYAGVLSLGVHTHFTQSGFEFSVGLDLVATGPQTGLGTFQNSFHNIAGHAGPSTAVLAGQIPNAIHPTALVEIARPFVISDSMTIRPFAEMQAGVEGFARLGGDFMWGQAWSQGVFIRDTTTGQVYQSARVEAVPGVTFLLGGDMARVFGSELLPSSGGYQMTPTRNRLRMGVQYQGEKLSAFYGVTWLGPEFTAQPEGQVLGALRLGFNF